MAEHFEVGSLVGGCFRLQELLYHGGKSDVFKAENEDEDEDCVLKHATNGVPYTEEIALLTAMRRADKQCKHVVRLRRSLLEGRAFVMEQGREYTYWKQKNTKVVPRLLSFGEDVLKALDFLHTKMKYAHCDLKLSNILYFEKHNPPSFKLVDFGAAKKIGENLVEYTVPYLPPEAASSRLSGEPVIASTSLDMWMLAATLLNVATKDSFWEELVDSGQANTEEQILRRLEQPDFVSSIPWQWDGKDLPDQLKRILLQDMLCGEQERKSASACLAHAFWRGAQSTAAAHEVTLGSVREERPWHWSARAKTAEFVEVPDSLHGTRRIYTRHKVTGEEWRDELFAPELDQLLGKFNHTSAGEVQVLEVHAVENKNMAARHEAHLKIWQERTEKGRTNESSPFRAGWAHAVQGEVAEQKRKRDEPGKKAVIGRLQPHLCANACSALAFAGVGSEAEVREICSNGFAVLCKTDNGFFGEGVYLTFDSAYAAIYGAGCMPLERLPVGTELYMVAAWTLLSNPYPVTRAADYTQSDQWCKLRGKKIETGYDSHFVLVDRVDEHVNYQACADADDIEALRCQYSELVLREEAQVLPRFVLKCCRRSLEAEQRELAMATKLQCCWRRTTARGRMQRCRRERAATVVQCCWRCRCGRLRVQRMYVALAGDVVREMRERKDDGAAQLGCARRLEKLFERNMKVADAVAEESSEVLVQAMRQHQQSADLVRALLSVLVKLDAPGSGGIRDALMSADAHYAVVLGMRAHVGEAEVQKAGVRALCNLAACFSAAMRDALVSVDAHGAVVSGMRAHVGEAEVQEWGVSALVVFAAGSAAMRDALVSADAHFAVVSGMRAHVDEAGVQEAGMRALCNLAAGGDGIRAALVSAYSHIAVVSGMRAHVGEAKVQKLGMEALYVFAAGSDTRRDALMSAGVHITVISGMRAHVGEAGVQKAGTMALYSLADGGSDIRRAALVSADAHVIVVSGMVAHLGEARVQEAGMRVLGTLIDGGGDGIRATLVSANAHGAVVSGMRAHVGEAGVQEWGVSVLAVLAAGSDARRNALVSVDAHFAVVLGMWECVDEAGVQEAGMRALGTLADGDGDGIRAALVSADSHVAVVSGMRAHVGEAGVQETGMRALITLAGSDARLDALVSADAHCAVVSGMRAHLGEAEVQKLGMGALYNLAFDSDARRDALMSADVHITVVSGMREHVDEAGVQELGTMALYSLADGGSDSRRAALVTANSHIAVVSGMVAHLGEVGMQEAGMRALCNLAAGSDARRDALVSVDAHIAVVSGMRAHVGEPGVQEAGMGTLTELEASDSVFGMLGLGTSSPRVARVVAAKHRS